MKKSWKTLRLEVPLPSAPCLVEASIAMRQVVMVSAMGIVILARPVAVGDDFGGDVEGFGEPGADVGWGRSGAGALSTRRRTALARFSAAMGMGASPYKHCRPAFDTHRRAGRDLDRLGNRSRPAARQTECHGRRRVSEKLLRVRLLKPGATDTSTL